LVEGGLLAKGPSNTSGLYIQSVDHRALSEIVAERLATTIDLGSVKPEEVAGFRDLLEVPTAQLAATRRTQAHLDSLRGIIDEEIATTSDAPNVPELNARFHAEVANASGNRVLAAFVAALHRAAHPLAFVNRDAELGRAAVSHHIEIHKALEACDPEAASTAMQSHLDYLRKHANSSGAKASNVIRLPQLLN
jgi:DNA-binding FadR family transcriptional regulator